jgi:hypothetical protein
MKYTANIATMPSRIEVLKKMLKSIEGQFDEVRIYLNGFTEIPPFLERYTLARDGFDLTDNGKFYWISPNSNEYYFTLDDDIEYPANYSRDMAAAIEQHGCIVTHHGRELLAKGVSYYRGHYSYRCMGEVNVCKSIDVAGTGVTAFSTNYFAPNIWHSNDKCMSDLVFSLEAAQQGKEIRILPHNAGYFKYLFPEEQTTIFERFKNKEQRQIEIADEILGIKNF